jgi:DNA-binding response OmpR family regulator
MVSIAREGGDYLLEPSLYSTIARIVLACPSGACSMKAAVLLVEDERMLANMLASLLREDGYEVTCATTAEEAVESIIKPDSNFAAIVSDVNLASSMTGVEVAHLLRQHHARAITILMTGASAKDVAACAPEGAIVLEKPFRPTEVLDALDALLH